MIEEAGRCGTDKCIQSKAVKHFPSFFRCQGGSENLIRATRLRKGCHEEIVAQDELRLSMIGSQGLEVRKRIQLKAKSGSGRKRTGCVQWLYPQVLEELVRLCSAGLKFNAETFLAVAKKMLLTTPHPIFTPFVILPSETELLIDKVNERWVRSFKNAHNIMYRTQTGKLSVSPAKQEQIDISVVVPMVRLCGGFQSGRLDNHDETHFIMNMDNGECLEFSGDDHIKYADIVSGGEGMMTVVCVTSGKNAKILSPFMILKNKACSYPIRGIPDKISDALPDFSKSVHD
ncbi:hypothetical protein R1flu_019059 [Riccia fluitans]|uniref:Uncharacterized protein n=1 Tax=Riccia fluitans TaxID=41844 RepID=A0ABD1ZJU6_9MARC